MVDAVWSDSTVKHPDQILISNSLVGLKALIAFPAFFSNRLEGGRKVSSEIEGHEGPVYALYAYPAPDGSGTCLVTGGGDGKVKTWDAEVISRRWGPLKTPQLSQWTGLCEICFIGIDVLESHRYS